VSGGRGSAKPNTFRIKKLRDEVNEQPDLALRFQEGAVPNSQS
jgi:hypothetical protein